MLRRVFYKLLLVAVVIFSLLALSGTLFAQGRSEDAFEHVKEVQERNALKLITKPGVVGTAIGLNEQGRHIILVFLEKSGVAGIPKELEGVPVKQKVSGKIYALKPPTDRPPKPPRALTATTAGESQINLDWKDSRGSTVLGYKVYRSESSGSYGVPIASVGSSNYSDTGLAPGTTYYYVVTAVSATEQSAYSNEASATTQSGSPEPPTKPQNLTAIGVSSSMIDLNWDDNPVSEAIDYYNVYRSESSGNGYNLIGFTVSSNYSDSSLMADTTYYYVVTAVNAVDESIPSDEASAMTEPETIQPPTQPQNLITTVVSSTEIDLNWDDNPVGDLVDYYNVYRSETSGEGYGLIGNTDVSSYSDTGLTPDTTYYYVVTAVNSTGESANSTETSDTTESGTEPVVDRQGWCSRPVPIGVSTGHPAITAGTISCRLKDISGNVFALSNNHVYAAENQASIDDNVLQPGVYDGGVNPDDAIGTLTAFVPILFYPFGTNTIDAAIALSSTDDLGNSTPSDGYGIPNSTTVGAYIGQAVQKYGRTTGLTKGTVTAVNGAFFVQYSTGFAIFTDQIVVEGSSGSFSGPGDSGSLVVTDNLSCNPVGLLFAGSSSQTIINPIDAVLGAFSGVSIDGKSE